MTPTHSNTLDLLEKPLAEFERGPIRQLIETEFELAVMQHIRATHLPITRDYESTLHDVVVPAVFSYVLEHMKLDVREGGTGGFTVYHLQDMRRQLHTMLSQLLEAMKSADGKSEKAEMHRVLLPFAPMMKGIARMFRKRKRRA